MVYPHTYRTEHSETITTNSQYGEYYAQLQSKKIKIQPKLLKILQFVDSNRNELMEDLAEAIKIKSVSNDLAYRDEVMKMIKFTENWLIKLDVKYESFNIGFYHVNGKKVMLPPIILAGVGNDPTKKTVCAYIHLDVRNPAEQDWDTDPWTLVSKEGKNYGCGAGCSKGPLLCWLHVVQAFRFNKMDLPVNLKFIFESMHHCNSQGLGEFVATRSQDFFANVELVIECGSEWIGPKHPCLTYGTVGILHFQVTIEKIEGSKTEIKDDMNNIFSTMVNSDNNVIIPKFHDFVEQITPDEEKTYENIQEFDPAEIRESLPPHKRDWDKVKLLMSFWRLPSIYVGDIEECICEKQDNKIIKRNFVIKIVQRQTVDVVDKLVKGHIQSTLKKLGIENKVTCRLVTSTRPWLENISAPAYRAARKATIQVYKEDPNMIREDGGRESATVFDNVLEKRVLVLPLCSHGSNLDAANENISNRNYYEGTKLLSALLFQLAAEKSLIS